ncbi:MAG: SDR family oxidoreductase [Acidimicrobiales bacterium]|nr:SDR family oxidoreductase [Acidimicrobiales bacterium]
MDSFSGRLAVVTGGGTGMGRELVVQLAAEGCSVATCDVNADTLAETARLALDGAPDGTRVTTHLADVADEAAMFAFRDAVLAEHGTDHVNLVFNNAGIGGGGSFLQAPRAEWERTFDTCWRGVYLGCRAFLPLLVAADEGHLVNTSSVNGFWASLGPGVPHTAYSAAKFAVKGFSEALLEDLRLNAPHVSVSVVMPGHIGTDIMLNSMAIHGDGTPREERAASVRENMAQRGVDAAAMDDDTVIGLVEGFGAAFRDTAPTTAAQAATVILDAVKAGEWRILIGDDARWLDEQVRAAPERIYGADGISLGGLFST